MLMPPYTVCCHQEGCGNPAVYKIAARWSDGVTEELKTYSLSCGSCLPELFRQSQTRRERCRLSGNESLEQPGVYELIRGTRDRGRQRMSDIEKRLNS